jgi:hypothetical protein
VQGEFISVASTPLTTGPRRPKYESLNYIYEYSKVVVREDRNGRKMVVVDGLAGRKQ